MPPRVPGLPPPQAARARLPQFHWSHGEVADLLEGRLDLDQYKSAAHTLENYRVLETGAFTRRPGSRFVARAKSDASPLTLLPFVVSTGAAYVIEVGEGSFRFYRNAGRLEVASVPVEIATPYPAAAGPEMKLAQSVDVGYIASPAAHPHALEHYSDTVWRLRQICNTLGGSPRPSREYGTRPPVGCTLLPGATSGNGVTFEAGADIFLASDASPNAALMGREILVLVGASAGARATIKTVVDARHVTADITQTFVDTSVIPYTDWKLTGSPLAKVTPDDGGPVGLITALHFGDGAPLAAYRAGDAGKFVHLNGGVYELGEPSPFSATDVPAVIRSAAAEGASGPLVTPGEPGAWSLEEAAWSAENGYPAAVAFMQGDRLIWGGTPSQPQTVWGSKTSDYENYAVGVLDDDAIEFTLNASPQLNRIVWLFGGRVLLIGTSGESFVVTGGSTDGPITPTNVQVKPASSYGSRSTVPPIRVGNALLFVTATGRRVRELVFDFVSDAYTDPDLLLLASHMTRPTKAVGDPPVARGLRRMVYQREPLSTLWGAREDGLLLSNTYLRDQNLVGWARHPMDASAVVEDVCVVPKEDGTGDRVWLAVKRTLPSGVVRTVEYLDDEGLVYDRLHVDGAVTLDGRILGATLTLSALTGVGVTATSNVPAFAAGDVGQEIRAGTGRLVVTAYIGPTQVTGDVTADFSSLGPYGLGLWAKTHQLLQGLDHLEGLTVWMVGDGAPLGQAVVTAGQVTFPQPCVYLEAGLPYVSTLETPRLDLQVGGSMQGQPVRVASVFVRVHESINLLVNSTTGTDGQRIFQRPFDVLPPTLWTGDEGQEDITRLGLDRNGRVKLQQDKPLPSTILYVQALVGVTP